jgi:hypothetical protein
MHVCVLYVLQVVAEAEAVFGPDGKDTATRAGADGMAYTLSGAHSMSAVVPGIAD